LLLIFFERGTGLMDLFLRSGAGLLDSLGARLIGLLSTRFLELEDLLASFPEALFVVGGPGFGGGDVGAGLFHGSLSAVAALSQNRCQRVLDEESVKDIKHRHEDDGGHGSEQ
jgi:hypothetical protein